MVNTYYNIHNHTLKSNTRFLDAINSTKGLIYNAYKKGLAGVSISDHQSLAAFLNIQQDMEELGQEHPGMFNNFQVTLGDEIYLVDKTTIDRARKQAKIYHQGKKDDKKNYTHNHKYDKFPYTSFYHFVLTARDARGYQLLEKINLKAWQDSFKFGRINQQLRLPTYKDWLAKEMQNYKGDIIASTACLGSELSQDINMPFSKRTWAHNDAIRFLNYLVNTFGKENIFFELMPSSRWQQKKVNNALWYISQHTGIRTIISTDSHYTDNNNEALHQAFLQAESQWRNVFSFYHFARLFSYDDLKQYFSNEVLQTSAQNSLDLLSSIQPIHLDQIQSTPEEKSIQEKTSEMADKLNNKYNTEVQKNVSQLFKEAQQFNQLF